MNKNESLVAYASRQMGINSYPSHLKKVAAGLEDIEKGKIKRLIVQMPPRSGKTCLGSEAFPEWYLERNPEKTVLSVFYSPQLASHISKQVARQNESHYKAIGVGDDIFGAKIDLIIMDDPTANRNDSHFKGYQRKLRHWYAGALRTRLADDGAIVVFQTCWSNNDLSNWLLKEYENEDWTLLKIPAVNEQNESYWPEQFPKKALSVIKSMISSHDWESLYQHHFLD